MWVIGGVNSVGGHDSDVWSSTDGKNWTLVTSSIPFAFVTSEDLNVTVFNDAMWAVFAGTTYSSIDGLTWTMKSAVGAIDSGVHRGNASLTVYAGNLWYIGGARNYDGTLSTAANSANDVWSSSDGIAWTQVSAGAPFASRWRHMAFVANNRLWVFGGIGKTAGVDGAVTADAWSTTDGQSWTKENVNALARGFLMQVVQEPTKATLIGGVQVGVANNVWQTTDGTNWSELSSHAQFSPRLFAQGIEFNGQMWLVGGIATNGDIADYATNEIWRSSDGVNWSLVTPSGPIFSARNSHGLVVFNNRLWVIGGQNNPTGVTGANVRLNDVWSSADGIAWRQETAGAAFSPRIVGYGVTVFEGKVWVIGGCTSATTCVNDVWSSADGVTWSNATPNAAFSPQVSTVTTFNNALWLINGENSTGGVIMDEIWRSTDGINWTQQTPGTHFASRTRFAIAALNNRLYVVGGISDGTNANYGTAIRYNDVWSSADGVTWRQDTAVAPFSPRSLHALITHNNELWLIGGYDLDTNNDVWRSSDGVNWRVGFSHDITAP